MIRALYYLTISSAFAIILNSGLNNRVYFEHQDYQDSTTLLSGKWALQLEITPKDFSPSKPDTTIFNILKNPGEVLIFNRNGTYIFYRSNNFEVFSEERSTKEEGDWIVSNSFIGTRLRIFENKGYDNQMVFDLRVRKLTDRELIIGEHIGMVGVYKKYIRLPE